MLFRSQQQKALSLQEEELKATREELARSAKAQEASEKTLNEQAEIFKQQQFEATFFSLFNQLIQINNNLLKKENNIYDFLFESHKNHKYHHSHFFILIDQEIKEIERSFNRLGKIKRHVRWYLSRHYQRSFNPWYVHPCCLSATLGKH